MNATTIDEVIRHLERIVSDAIDTGSPLGIFAQVYLHVTRKVKEGILAGRFEDGQRMETLDVVFANRYFEALQQYQDGVPCARSWKTAFDAAHACKLTIFQQVLLGMNVHINFDLGIATIETVSPEQLSSLETDFFKINQLLIEQINTVQDKLNAVSPVLALLDRLGGNRDEKFAGFSLKKVRSHAWNVAERLSRLSHSDKSVEIEELDRYVTVLNRLITEPGIVAGAASRVVRWFEPKDIRAVLEIME